MWKPESKIYHNLPWGNYPISPKSKMADIIRYKIIKMVISYKLLEPDTQIWWQILCLWCQGIHWRHYQNAMCYNFHVNAYVDFQVPVHMIIMHTMLYYVYTQTFLKYPQGNQILIVFKIYYKCSLKIWCRTYQDNINHFDLKIPIICDTKITTTTLAIMLSMIIH